MSIMAIFRQLIRNQLIQQRNDEDHRRSERDGYQTLRPSLVFVTKVSDRDQHRCYDHDEAREECH